MKRERYIPTDYTEIVESEKAKVIIYHHPEKPFAIAYSGKKSKPDFHYDLKTVERKDNYIQEYISSKEKEIDEREAHKRKQKELLLKELNEIVPGKTIIYTSWGYDQTNVDWYLVTGIKGKTLTLQEIGHDIHTSEGYSSMSGNATPNVKKIVGSEFKQSIRNTLKVNGYYARVWDKLPKYVSWYA